MSRPLFLVTALPAGDAFTLDGPEGHHAADVQRLGVGRGAGARRRAGRHGRRRRSRPSRRGALDVTVTGRGQAPPSDPRLVVVQGIAKGDRGELAVQAMTEVGVDEIVPWAATRSVARWRGDAGRPGPGEVGRHRPRGRQAGPPPVAAGGRRRPGRVHRDGGATDRGGGGRVRAARGGDEPAVDRRPAGGRRHRAGRRAGGWHHARGAGDVHGGEGDGGAPRPARCCAPRPPASPRSRCSAPASAAGEARGLQRRDGRHPRGKAPAVPYTRPHPACPQQDRNRRSCEWCMGARADARAAQVRGAEKCVPVASPGLRSRPADPTIWGSGVPTTSGSLPS